MGQLGFAEMAVIFVIALLVFGPKKLPELGKSIGKGLKEFRRATGDLKQSWDEQMRELENSTKDIQKAAHDVTSEVTNAKEEFYKNHGQPSPTPSAETPAEPASDATSSTTESNKA